MFLLNFTYGSYGIDIAYFLLYLALLQIIYMTIKELFDKKIISVRSYNVCTNHDINTVEDLFEYLNVYKSFKFLRNCGKKSELELWHIINNYQNDNIQDAGSKESEISEIISNLSRFQREIINNYIKYRVVNLSVRSKNGLCNFLDNNFSIRNLNENILKYDYFNFNKLDNIGNKSIKELEDFIDDIVNYIKLISSVNNESDLTIYKNRYLIESNYQIDNTPDDILLSNSIFKITDYLLKKLVILKDNKYNIILTKGFKLYKDKEPLNLDNLSNIIDISRERVRQIRKVISDDFYKCFFYINSINDDLYKNYKIEVNTSIIKINDELADHINEFCGTNFTKEFITYLVYVFLKNEYFILGNPEDVLINVEKNSKSGFRFNNFYLINKEFEDILDYGLFIGSIYSKLNSKIENTYTLNLKTYIYRYLKISEIEIIDNLLPIIEKILFDEFGLYLDINDNITFNRNTIKLANEYTYEALEALGKPSKVSEITNKIKELFPEFLTDENKVRSSMKREFGFVPVGRDSVFGLKKWESEIDDFKGGTIRSITIEFLEGFDIPKHISEIAEYVSKYREGTYQRSIVDNLKADQSNSFIFFNQGFIGLKRKETIYNCNKYMNLPKQLGKKILGMKSRKYDDNYIISFLKSQYDLTTNEVICLMDNLKSNDKKYK